MPVPTEVLDTEDKKQPSGVDLDTILVEEIGQFGKYQIRSLALILVSAFFVGLGAGTYIFTVARVGTRCLIPECDEATPSFAPPWILNAIPGSSAASFESCERYANTSSELDQTCPASLFDQQATQPCDHYVYEDTNTVVYEFGLACDEWRRSLIGSARTLGSLTVLPLTGYTSDRWGRRTALAVNAINAGWIGVSSYWATSYVGFAIAEFAETSFGSGSFSCAYILVMEIVGPQYRVIAGATLNSFFALGQASTALLAWLFPYWRHLTLAVYLPQLICIAYFWVIAESVRWLMSKGRYQESEVILKNMAKVNGKELSEKALEMLQITAEAEKKQRVLMQDEMTKTPWLPVLVFRCKPVLITTLISPIWWITMTLVYYGMSINSVNISGNSYINYMAVALVEIPGYWTSVLLVSKIGRKPVLIGAYWLCAACQIAFIFLPDNVPGLSLAVFLFGKSCISAVLTTLYIYTAELYPTRNRHSLFAFSSMIGRIGSVVAPLTPALSETVWEPFPFILFAGFSLLSGALVFFSPETLGSKLPESMEDSANLRSKKI